MIHRTLAPELHKQLLQSPAVALLGARQVGKTTLSKSINLGRETLYLDLESPRDLLKLSDANAYLESHSDKLIILDEIQRKPDLFMILRGIIDNNRQQGIKSGQFLLLGSASMDLLRQSSESLAGRIRYIEMGGLNVLEIDSNIQARHNLWLRGGFPESYLTENDEVSMDWLEDLVRTYLERDIPQMGFRVPAARLRRLWTMLAHLQGEPVNYSKLAGNLEIERRAVGHYIDILTDLLLIRRLDPWHANVKKRLVKSPRFYIRDSGIQHLLLGINSYDSLLSNPILGKSWEGFVIENIHSVLPRRAETYFYRTAAGAEIDLVIKMPSSEIWAIEIKHGTTPKLGKNFHQTCNDIQASKKFIIYGGDDEFPLSGGATVISLMKLMKLLQSE